MNNPESVNQVIRQAEAYILQAEGTIGFALVTFNCSYPCILGWADPDVVMYNSYLAQQAASLKTAKEQIARLKRQMER